MSQTLLIVTGPPGAGKTTISAIMAEQADPSVHVEGDAFFSFVKNGYLSPWSPESSDQNRVVIEASVGAAAVYARSERMTVLDGVFVPQWLPLVKETASAHGIDDVHYGILMAPLDVCLGRFEGRHGDDAPFAMVEQMHAKFDDLGDYAKHVIMSGDTAEGTARDMAAAFAEGRLKL